MLGYSEIEHIDDPSLVTLAVNPKEYIETFESENVNKKHNIKDFKKVQKEWTLKTNPKE